MLDLSRPQERPPAMPSLMQPGDFDFLRYSASLATVLAIPVNSEPSRFRESRAGHG